MTALPTNTGPGKLPGPLEKLLAGTGKAFNTADNFLQKPGGSLLMNLLAQQGYSTMPGSPLGAIGRAGIATQQQQQQMGASDLKRRLIESQIGLNAKRAETSGRYPIQVPSDVRRFKYFEELGDPDNPDELTPAQKRFLAVQRSQQFENIAGAGAGPIDPITGALNPTVPEDTIVAGAAARKGAEQRASSGAQADVEAENTLPAQIAKDQEFIDKGERFIKMLENNELNTGPIVGNLPALSTNAQLFQAFAGENVIQSISSATFGQLSEGERKFIETTNPNRGLTEEANIDIIKTKIKYVKRAQERAKARLDDVSNVIDFNDLPD